MQQLLFGIFAHPDDEAFGPSATLMQQVQQGTQLHLICVTDGQNGTNPDKLKNLGAVRRQEWLATGKTIGATRMNPLGYMDGTLNNQLFHEIADTVEHIVRQAAKTAAPAALSFMTFDPNGLTGHLDHIAVSNITTYVFYKLKANPPTDCTITELAYYCWPRSAFPVPNTNFVFMPAGRGPEFINRQIDVGPQRNAKYKLMRLHHTQRGDAAAIMALGNTFHSTDYFHVIT